MENGKILTVDSKTHIINRVATEISSTYDPCPASKFIFHPDYGEYTPLMNHIRLIFDLVPEM